LARNLLKEAGRRKLAVIPYDHELPTAGDSAQCVHWLDLACFIYQEEVEFQGPRRQVLGDRHRRHHEYRLHRLNRLARLLQELPQGEVPPLLLDFASKDTELANVTGTG